MGKSQKTSGTKMAVREFIGDFLALVQSGVEPENMVLEILKTKGLTKQ